MMQRLMEVVELSYLLFLDSLADWRDVSIIAVGFLTFIVLAVIVVVVAVLGYATRILIRRANKLLNDELSPLVGTAQETLDTVRGTASFVSESTVKPIARAYGVVAGAKRAASVITGCSSWA